MRKAILALATFAGTTIGVGLFGLPYAAAQVGFVPMLVYFFILGFIMLIINLVLGEIALRTKEAHRLPGYAEIYLGKTAKMISMTSITVGLYVAMIAYIVIGGGFFASLLIPFFGGSEFLYTMIFYFSAILVIFLGSKTIAKSELISLIIFFAALLYLFIIGAPKIDMANFNTVDYSNIFLPYGVILFSLAGASIIPEIREMLEGRGRMLRTVITAGTFIPIVTYIIFIFLVLGVTGDATTQDALTGLQGVLGSEVLIPGLLFAIIATFTSYVSIGLTLKKVFWYDFKWSHLNAWLGACLIPLGLYFAGFNNFITIAAFSGAVTMGVDSILIFLIYLKARKTGERIPEYRVIIPKPIVYILIVIFLIGAMMGLNIV